jgi:hypothetical protein
MGSMTQTPGIPASRDGYSTSGNAIPAIRNTRYLSAAAHLRRPMLPNEVTDPGTGTSRPPLPVGRAYAIRVLFRHGSRIPMLAVDMARVKKNCWIAIAQTTLRDMTAIGALAAGLIVEPWGMIITLAVVAAAVMLIRRSRFFLALVFLGVICVALALVNGNSNERILLGTPLACLALCFLIYLADVWLSMHYVRRIWRRSARQETLAAPGSSPADGSLAEGKARSVARNLTVRTSAESEYRAWPYRGSLGHSGTDTNGGPGNGSAYQGNARAWNGSHGRNLGSPGHGRDTPAVGGPIRIYYAANEIVGAGTALRPLPLTVPLHKPLDTSRDVDTFSVSELMADISGHLRSQGTGDAEVHGWAYQPLTPNGKGYSSRKPGHFTYGLPHLDVTEVVATPAPDKDRWLGTPFTVTRLDYRSPLDDGMLGLANRSPSAHAERHYVRVMTTSWNGQLTATVFVNAALQGHFLRLMMRPYVLAPAVNELGAADELIKWNPFFLACVAVSVTTRQFRSAAAKFKRPGSRPDKKSGAKRHRSDLYSTREYYARPYVSNMHQSEDADRAILLIEEKVFMATMDFLRKHNVDITEYEKQAQNIIYNNTMLGDGVFNTGSNNQINNSKGNENKQSNSKSS